MFGPLVLELFLHDFQPMSCAGLHVVLIHGLDPLLYLSPRLNNYHMFLLWGAVFGHAHVAHFDGFDGIDCICVHLVDGGELIGHNNII